MKNIAILCGGQSAEHKISLCSVKNIISSIDRKLFNPIIIGIKHDGSWWNYEEDSLLVNDTSPNTIALSEKGSKIAVIPGERGNSFVSKDSQKSIGNIDAVFPVLHGPRGEDGCVQGLLKLLGLPFVAPGVLGSAVSMDKDIMKKLLRDSDIPIGKFITVEKGADLDFATFSKELGTPVFVKPANMGSSVGVSKAECPSSFKEATTEAFKYDQKIIIEQQIIGREIECAVMGNRKKLASTVAGEIVTPTNGLYSFDAKYINDNEADLILPAKIDKSTLEAVRELSIKACDALCADGMSRVDMFLTESGELILNEINTIPGFTDISMYPKLWEASGVPQKELISKLIDYAIEKHEISA